MKRKSKQKRSFILKILILGVCVYMIATLANLWTTLNKSKAELNSLKEKYSATQNDVKELKAMLKDESNTKIKEKAVRERLGYIYSGEQIFIDVSGN